MLIFVVALSCEFCFKFCLLGFLLCLGGFEFSCCVLVCFMIGLCFPVWRWFVCEHC